MKSFIEKHPFWFALGFTLVVMQALGFVVTIVGSRILGLPLLPVRVTATLVTTLVPLGFIWWLGWWQDSGLVSTTRNVYALTVPLILMFFPLIFYGTVALEASQVSLLLVAVLLTGISEEVVYRGLFVRAFLPQGKWQALLLPAVFFAAAHSVQSLFGLMSLQDNLVQMTEVLIFGILYGAVRLRINNIWPLIMLHAIGDLFWVTAGLLEGVIQMSDVPLSHYFIVWVPSIITAVYLMRKPITATIDGQPVDMVKESRIPAVEGQPVG